MQLRDYQQHISDKAAKLLQEYKIAYLCMGMRTGKSVTSFAAAEKYGSTDVLFVTKLKAISSIEKDYKSYNPSFRIKIVNYESVGSLKEVGFDLVILDESHCCGQFPIPAERTKHLKKICYNKPIIFLSGTPSAESYSQLYHQFYISSFSPFKEYKNFYTWAKDFVIIGKKYFFNRQVNDYTKANKEKIDQYTKHLFINYTQKEAGFAQVIEEDVIYVKMKESTYWLADKLIKKRVHIGKEGQEIIADTEVKLLQKLWQIYSGTIIAENKEGICFDHTKASYIKENLSNQKIAIYYVFKAEYLMLVWAFGINKLTSDPIEFNNSKDKIFVSQMQSGSMGINLSSADLLVMLNIHYSNVLYWQVRERLQVMERETPAKVLWIFSENGIESKIYETVKNKQDYVLSYFRKDYNIKKQLI